MSAQLHIVNEDQRLRQVRGDGLDTSSVVSDAYEQAATEETLRRLRAIREGVTVLGIDATLRLSTLLSSITPQEAIPFFSETWVKADFSGGTTTLRPKPYRVIAMQETVQGGQIPFQYNSNTGELEAIGEYDGYDGTAWLIEVRYENPYVENHVGRAHGFRTSHFETYPPPHLAYVTELVEEARQKGARPDTVFRLGQGALGVPFAYEAGEIVDYQRAGGVGYAVIETESGGEVASFIPSDASLEGAYSVVEDDLSTTGAPPLKAPGVTVQKFEPLCVTTAEIGTPGTSDREAGQPVEVQGTNPPENQITFGTSPDFAEGQIIEIRVLTQDFDRTLRVESSETGTVTVIGEVPPMGQDDTAYVVPLASRAQGAKNWSISLSTPYKQQAPSSLIRNEIKRALPPGVPANISIESTA